MNRRGALFWVGMAAALLLVGLLFGGSASTGRPLDPAGTDGIGTRALMLLLEEYGVTVTRTVPDGPGTGVVLVLDDRLDGSAREELLAWVDDGGTLVVADPGSEVAPALPIGFQSEGSRPSGRCTVDELAGLSLEAAGYTLYEAGEGRFCFAGGDGAYLVETERGRGRIVLLGSASPLTNEYLDLGDNAALAATLLIPDPGAAGTGDDAGTVAVLYDPVVTPGSGSLTDLVATPVRWAGWQLLVAFALLVWNRARRFGRPVREAQAVELPGSLLVRATGELLRRTGSTGHASTVIRRHTLRRFQRSLSLPSDASPAVVADELVERFGADRDTAALVLGGPPAPDRAALVSLVVGVDALAAAASTVPPPDTPAPDHRPATTGATP